MTWILKQCHKVVMRLSLLLSLSFFLLLFFVIFIVFTFFFLVIFVVLFIVVFVVFSVVVYVVIIVIQVWNLKWCFCIHLCVHWWLFFSCQNYILSNLKRMIFSFGEHTKPRISITFYFDLFDVGVYSWSTSQWPSAHFYQNALKLCKNNSYSNFLVI